MHFNIKFLLMVSTLSFLTGCSVLGGTSSGVQSVTYVLNPKLNSASNSALNSSLKPNTQQAKNLQGISLALAPVRSSGFDNRDNLVFANQQNTRATYQYAFWSEKPSRRFDELMFANLEQSGLYQLVVPVSANVAAEHLLVSELLEFYHDATESPGLVKVKMRFSVYDQAQLRLLSRKTIVTQQALQQFNAHSAAEAFNLATAQMLTEVSLWLGHVVFNAEQNKEL